MKRLHIVGGKNHGKTTLIMELVKELNRRGQTVGTIKHTHHQHELDVPGKDSYHQTTVVKVTSADASPHRRRHRPGRRSIALTTHSRHRKA